MDWAKEYSRLCEILISCKKELELAKKAYDVANEIITIYSDLQEMKTMCAQIK